MEARLGIRGVRRKLVVGTVGVLAAGGTFLALGPAAANGSTHSSTISLHYVRGQSAFQGKVKSDTTDCIIGRSVLLFQKTVPSHEGHRGESREEEREAGHDREHSVRQHSVEVGSSQTNIHGFYRIPFPLTPGVYYTVARQMSLPGYSNTVCGRAVSILRVIS